MCELENLEALRAALRANAPDIARQILGEPTARDARGLRFRRRRSLALTLSGDRAGTFYDHEAGEGGDLLALIMRERGCGFGEAVAWARDVSGLDGARKPGSGQRVGDGARVGRGPERAVEAPAAAMDAARERQAREGARRLWARARPITTEDDVGRYLTARGCRPPARVGDLRRLPPSPHHPLTTMVARVSDARDPDRGMTLHLTPVRPDGTRGDKRLMAGLPKAGGVVRLDPDDAATTGLHVAEGIETALAMPAPAWATVDAGNLANLPVLAGIEALTIAVDADDAGRRAAEMCARRWHAAGCEVRLVEPGGGDGA